MRTTRRPYAGIIRASPFSLRHPHMMAIHVTSDGAYQRVMIRRYLHLHVPVFRFRVLVLPLILDIYACSIITPFSVPTPLRGRRSCHRPRLCILLFLRAGRDSDIPGITAHIINKVHGVPTLWSHTILLIFVGLLAPPNGPLAGGTPAWGHVLYAGHRLPARRGIIPGDRFCAIEKGQGLKKGEKVKCICLCECVSNKQEELWEIVRRPWRDGRFETSLEGFPGMDSVEFVLMFCKHMKVTHKTIVNRIEFRRV